jgi:hypothetical protein
MEAIGLRDACSKGKFLAKTRKAQSVQPETCSYGFETLRN